MGAENEKLSAIERMQKSNEHGVTKEDAEKLAYRTKASTQWVAHYIRVAELKAQYLAENPDGVFTAEIAEQMLIESWEAKEDTKKSTAI